MLKVFMLFYTFVAPDPIYLNIKTPEIFQLQANVFVIEDSNHTSMINAFNISEMVLSMMSILAITVIII